MQTLLYLLQVFQKESHPFFRIQFSYLITKSFLINLGKKGMIKLVHGVAIQVTTAQAIKAERLTLNADP